MKNAAPEQPEQQTQFYITPTGNEITIRHGDALPVAHKEPIDLVGTLEAPFQFLSGKEEIKSKLADDCHIEIRKDKGEIKLIILDQHPHSKSIIVGSLTKDTELAKFGLNTDRRWSISEFLKFIKTMRYYFTDRAQHSQLIESMQKWSAKIERVITEHNDNKGNSNLQLETKVHAVEGLLPKFSLNIPIFQGYSKHKFDVEIGLDPKATAVLLYLISDDLIELEIQQREKLIESELAKFADFNCSKVVIS